MPNAALRFTADARTPPAPATPTAARAAAPLPRRRAPRGWHRRGARRAERAAATPTRARIWYARRRRQARDGTRARTGLTDGQRTAGRAARRSTPGRGCVIVRADRRRDARRRRGRRRRPIRSQPQRTQQGAAAVRRAPSDEEDDDDAPTISPSSSSQGVTKVYAWARTSVHALRGVDLTVTPGEMIAVMGTSGSGKSTLMNILGCLDVPTDGRATCSTACG